MDINTTPQKISYFDVNVNVSLKELEGDEALIAHKIITELFEQLRKYNMFKQRPLFKVFLTVDKQDCGLLGILRGEWTDAKFYGDLDSVSDFRFVDDNGEIIRYASDNNLLATHLMSARLHYIYRFGEI